VVTTDLALGGVAWAVWHAVLAAPALAAAPAGLRARLSDVPLGLRRRLSSVSVVALTALALVVGSATHVLWDEFTHARRWGDEHIPVLAKVYGPLHGWAWAQQVSGGVGAVVLLVWFVRWWRRTPVREDARRPAAWWAWAFVAATGVGVGGAAALAAPRLGSAALQGAT
jgi:O-antigen/teichoic acid export membrane protein